MGRYDITKRIAALDAERDHLQIMHYLVGYEFPWDWVRALEMALYRTFRVPTTSRTLVESGEFERRPQRRYDDTALLMAEIVEWGYDSNRGKASLRRINRFHRQYDIANEDFLYVLSTLHFEPIRWVDRFGWRRLTAHERRTFRYDDANMRIATATRELFVSWAPKPLQPIVRLAIHSLLDDAMRASFGFPRPPRVVEKLVAGALRMRGRALRYFPSRQRKHFVTGQSQRSWSNGYEISDLGPPPLLARVGKRVVTARRR